MSYSDHSGRPAITSRVAIRVEDTDGPGGDFACSYETGPERLRCVIGDVTGHGPRAARFRLELVDRLALIARAGGGPASLLARVNAEIDGVWPTDIFACLVCIDVDLRRARATIAVAGHLPPILKRLGHAHPVPVEAGAPVGTFSNERYAETELRLEPEALLVVATDGIGDALMTDVDPLGLLALADLVARAPREPDALCGFVFASATRLSSRLKDDATVLALQLSALPARRRGSRLVEADLVSAA
jgi:serine phosphatase RsbU (regulator of sigma subunit)